MQKPTTLAQSSLLNHLTTTKLTLTLLERERPLSHKQRGLVQLALDAADDVIVEVVRT